MKQSQAIIPSGISENALTGHLNVATFCTEDLEGYKHFYGEIMKMQIEGPFSLSAEEKQTQRSFWHIPDEIDYDLYHFYRASVPSLVHMRVLHLKTSTPRIHQSYNSYELGTFSLGFPTSDAKAMDERMKAYEVEAMAAMQLGDIVRANGEKGQYLEIIYKGPDYLHCVGIERVNFPQLAPCDPKDGFGGPGYSALVPIDSQAEMDFYTEVLDFFVLFDANWETAEGSALGTGPGVPFRFVALYAQGAEQNHILLLDFKDGNQIDTGVPSHLPNQGLGMYTYQSSNIEEVQRRAVSHGVEVLSPIKEVNDSILGRGKACLLLSPNKMYIEIFQTI
ncbi:MAG: VOC family protein [Bacteroidota bacterium]